MAPRRLALSMTPNPTIAAAAAAKASKASGRCGLPRRSREISTRHFHFITRIMFFLSNAM